MRELFTTQLFLDILDAGLARTLSVTHGSSYFSQHQEAGVVILLQTLREGKWLPEAIRLVAGRSFEFISSS